MVGGSMTNRGESERANMPGLATLAPHILKMANAVPLDCAVGEEVAVERLAARPDETI